MGERRRAAGAAIAAVLTVAALVAGARPAAAAGSRLYPVADRYEAGEEATLVGYASPGSLGWLDDGPFFAYLRGAPSPFAAAPADGREPFLTTNGLPLGSLTVADERHPSWLAWRVNLTFTVPDNLPPGSYEVVYCNDPCSTGLGDLLGGMVYVGVDASSPVIREWPLDEPEIANLDAEAFITGSGFDRSTAEEVRSGRVPVAAPRALPPGPAPISPPASVAARAAPRALAIFDPQPAPAPVDPALPFVFEREGRATERGHVGLLLFGGLLAALVVVAVLVALGPGAAGVRPPGARLGRAQAGTPAPAARHGR